MKKRPLSAPRALDRSNARPRSRVSRSSPRPSSPQVLRPAIQAPIPRRTSPSIPATPPPLAPPARSHRWITRIPRVSTPRVRARKPMRPRIPRLAPWLRPRARSFPSSWRPSPAWWSVRCWLSLSSCLARSVSPIRTSRLPAPPAPRRRSTSTPRTQRCPRPWRQRRCPPSCPSPPRARMRTPAVSAVA